jgi:hypothetical protein
METKRTTINNRVVTNKESTIGEVLFFLLQLIRLRLLVFHDFNHRPRHAAVEYVARQWGCLPQECCSLPLLVFSCVFVFVFVDDDRI